MESQSDTDRITHNLWCLNIALLQLTHQESTGRRCLVLSWQHTSHIHTAQWQTHLSSREVLLKHVQNWNTHLKRINLFSLVLYTLCGFNEHSVFTFSEWNAMQSLFPFISELCVHRNGLKRQPYWKSNTPLYQRVSLIDENI